MLTPIVPNRVIVGGHRSGKRTLPIEKGDIVPREEVQDNIIETAILKEKITALTRNLDNHIKENRSDNKDLHKRISDLRDDIQDELEGHRNEAKKMMTWRWMMTGVLIALTFAMTAVQTYSSFVSSQ
tara:strand:+ start:71 stop:451 length:381 start_codon:yes stop_codon:yes gene_type:complete